jgi:hypothetical protein
MVFKPGTFLGNNPARYAERVLAELGATVPPTDERAVAEYRRVKLREFSTRTLEPELAEALGEACAWLRWGGDGECSVFVNKDMARARQRLATYHEFGHLLLPWHRDLNYLDDERDLDPTTRQPFEREAFRCGAEFLMPRRLFLEDVLSTETGVAAIEQLRGRYGASMEATAIHYAYTHPGSVAVLVVGPPDRKPVPQGKRSPKYQLSLPIARPPAQLALDFGPAHPLVVRYSVRSRRFPLGIPSGTGIAEDSRIFSMWRGRRRAEAEVTAGDFVRVRGRGQAVAECNPLGCEGKMLLLLRKPDRQTRLEFVEGMVL